MKSILCLLVAILSSQTVLAARDTGGGDPAVLEFLKKGEQIVQWTKAHPKEVSVSGEQMEATLKQLATSLDGNGPAKLIFTDENLKDQNGVSKAALFDRNAGNIRVNRKLWNSYKDTERYTVAAIELLGLSGSEARYEEAIIMNRSLIVGVLRCTYFDIRGPLSYETMSSEDFLIANTPNDEAYHVKMDFELRTKIDVKVDVIVGKSEAGPESWNGAFKKIVVTSGSKVIFSDARTRIMRDLGGGTIRVGLGNNNGKQLVSCSVGSKSYQIPTDKETVLGLF